MRRAIIGVLGAVLFCSLTVGLADHANVKPTKITFFVWAGSNQGVVPKEVIKSYEQAHPGVDIQILESNNTITYPKMVAAQRTTPNNPLVDCGFFNVDSINKGDIDGMWESLDPSQIPNMANVLPQYRRPGDRGVGYQMTGIGLIYNKNYVKTPPTSWADLWSPKYKGRVAMFDYDTRMMVVAAMLNGGGVNNMTPGFKVWADHADNIRALVDSNDALKNLLVSGDAWIAPWFSALATVWIKEGAPLGYVTPKEGAIAFPIYLTIVKGVNAAQRVVCEDLINRLLSPENAGRYGQLTYSVPVVKNAAMTEAQKNDPNLNLDVAKNAILLDYAKIAQMTPTWKDLWDREVKTKLH